VLRETTSFVLMEQNITSEGLFRVPPHSRLRDALKEAYDRGQKYIIWKDNDIMLPVPPYPHAEHQDEILADVVPSDAYSVFMAAALIKAWYASLRQPIFPTDTYRDLKRKHGDSQEVMELDKLSEMLSPTSQWSFLPTISREIICRHLLPLLSAVAARQEQNKMTAENLAVCFAPGLLCGPDQLEDAKMSSIIRRIFTQAIDMWSDGLREACGQIETVFYEELKLPQDENDWEDPADPKRDSMDSRGSIEDQMSGITLQDNEAPMVYHEPQEDQEEQMPPPLPPRSRAASSKSSITSSTSSVQRKPAPPLTVPPRYSTVISDAPENVAESPLTYAATTDGFAPRGYHDDGVQAQWSTPSDEKKSGTNDPVPVLPSVSASARSHAQENASCPVSTSATKLHIPKRKNLTARQIDNVHRSSGVSPVGGMALPGLTGNNNNVVASPASAVASPSSAVSATASEPGFRYPSAPKPNHSPSINTLARPVYPIAPQVPIISHPTPKSTSLPVPNAAPRLRTPSPSLMQRMPSFENFNRDKEPQQTEESSPGNRTLKPTKVNLKKQSVEDLRKLYEERAGTANALVEAAKHRQA
jgi:Rho GTPase-activating protein 1